MNKTARFNKKLIASAIASTMLSGLGGYAVAQDDNLEEVMVTGIRGSLERSMDVKRESAGVVDAISSEDIGKFPDTNLAESLQRITGVSISRNNGEGAEVTVRGFGAGNNMVTLNGRTMPAAQTANGDGGGSRAFDFGNLASESISGVEVYKTGKANITTGGIGATINVLTAKPLDKDGFNGSVGVKAVHDTTNRFGDDVTPELSGLFSWANDDSTFGVGLSASHQKRDSAMTGAFVNGWNVGVWDSEDVAENGLWQSKDAEIINAPEDGQLFARPDDIRYEFSDTQRTRDNAQLTVQFAPTEDFTATADYTFAENESQTHLGQSGQWMQQQGFIRTVEFDDGAVAVPLYVREDYFDRAGAARDEGFEQQWNEQTNTLESVGLNFKYQVNDALDLALDIHDSEMHSRGTGPTDANGRATGQVRLALGAPTVVAREWWFGGSSAKLPTYLNQYNDAIPGRGANANGVVDAGDVGSTMLNLSNADQLSTVTQVKLDGSFKFENDARFDFGIETREMESHTVRYAAQDKSLGGWDADYPGEFGDLVKPFDLHGEFDDFSPNMTNAHSFRANPVDLYNYLIQNPTGTAGFNNRPYDYTNVVPATMVQTVDNRVNEDMQAAYFQFAAGGNLGDMPFNLLAGLRYETTDVTSSSLSAGYRSIWASDNDITIQPDPNKPSSLISAKASYDNLLPSFDFTLNITDDVVSRFSFSKTIARADLNRLGVSASGFGAGGGSTLLDAKPSAEASNPALLPLESTNFDLSVEWYYDDASYASIGLFEKNVFNFLGTEQKSMELLDIRNPTAGPRAKAAIDSLESRGLPVTDENLHNMIAFNEFIANGGRDSAAWIAQFGDVDYAGTTDQNLWIQGGSTRDVISNDSDPAYMFDTKVPNNGREAKIHGIEFAVQHFFGETGFGVQANYTIVRGDVAYDNLGDPKVSQFYLVGLSDTANLVGMYENDNFSARIAYNWRDKYITGAGRGSGNNPLYVEAYSQIDLNVTYSITEALSLSFEGINVTGEDSRTHQRNYNMMESLRDLGARYQIGARYTF